MGGIYDMHCTQCRGAKTHIKHVIEEMNRSVGSADTTAIQIDADFHVCLLCAPLDSSCPGCDTRMSCSAVSKQRLRSVTTAAFRSMVSRRSLPEAATGAATGASAAGAALTTVSLRRLQWLDLLTLGVVAAAWTLDGRTACRHWPTTGAGTPADIDMLCTPRRRWLLGGVQVKISVPKTRGEMNARRRQTTSQALQRDCFGVEQ